MSAAHMRWLEYPLLLLVPACMVASLIWTDIPAAALMLLVVIVVLVLFFMSYDRARPGLRQLMPVLVLSALAAAGRILFAPIPDVKPVSAIAIIAGVALGRREGFMVGALAALTSNFFFGQGMWTPWQMYAWGLVGYGAGLLNDAHLIMRLNGQPRMALVLTYGALSGFIFGAIINSYDILGFVRPLTWGGAIARLVSALPFDILHSLATCAFLAVLFVPWIRRIERVVQKFMLHGYE
ncbi:ECF transporter S component [Collinsella sp. zg1085]|nr:ECF transporter S component [Collinsella sp. zg1085]